MERLVLANAMASLDFWLLNSDNVRNMRGDWGEVMEIRFPGKEIFIYIDENQNGFAKSYSVPNGEKTQELLINRENLITVMKNIIDKARC